MSEMLERVRAVIEEGRRFDYPTERIAREVLDTTVRSGPDPLTKMPLAVRQEFCRLLLADEIHSWFFFDGHILIAHNRRRLLAILEDGSTIWL